MDKDQEYKLLTQDVPSLEANKDTAGLEVAKEAAELSENQEAIDAIETSIARVRSVAEQSVVERGGTQEGLAAVTAPIEEEIKAVQTDTVEKIGAVQNNEDSQNAQIKLKELEMIKTSPEFGVLLESAKKLEEYNKKYAAGVLDQFGLEDSKKETGIYNDLIKKILGEGGSKQKDPSAIIGIDQAIQNWKSNLEEASNIPEYMRDQLATVEKNFQIVEKQAEEIENIKASLLKNWKSMSGPQRYNEVVLGIQNIAKILGGKDYGTGLDYIRNPDSFNLINEDVILQQSEIATSFKETVPEEKLRDLSKIYPPEVVALMEKKDELVTKVQNTIKRMVELRDTAKRSS